MYASIRIYVFKLPFKAHKRGGRISVQWKGNLLKEALYVEIIWNHNSNPYWGQNVVDRRNHYSTDQMC